MVIIASAFNKMNFWNVCETFEIYFENSVIPLYITTLKVLIERICRFPPIFRLLFCRFPPNVYYQLPIVIFPFPRNLFCMIPPFPRNLSYHIKGSLPRMIQHTTHCLAVYWMQFNDSILVGIKAFFSDLDISEYNPISIYKLFFRFLLP